MPAQAADKPIEIWADPAKLRQVLLNLMSNAVKFTEPGGMVTVGTKAATANDIVLWVADTGIGMLPEQIAIALTPFGQVDSRLARRYEGTGLGLPLTNSLVELHGGSMRVDSGPGRVPSSANRSSGFDASSWTFDMGRLVGCVKDLNR